MTTRLYLRALQGGLALTFALTSQATAHPGASPAAASPRPATTGDVEAADVADAALQRQREDKAQAYFGDEVLTDHNGRQHRFFSDLLRGRTVLINVVYTECPDACPLMTEHLRQVRMQLGSAFGEQIQFLSLSVDPARDTPAVLKEFAVRRGVDEPGWLFLVADRETLGRILKRLGQWSDRPEDHTTLLIAGNASRAHWVKLRPDASPERIAADLRRL